jgi:hypothetical protein
MEAVDLNKWERITGLVLDKIEECAKRNDISSAREWSVVLSAVAHSEKVKP